MVVPGLLLRSALEDWISRSPFLIAPDDSRVVWTVSEQPDIDLELVTDFR